MRAFSQRDVERVVIACGAQMGKTESLLNVLGHRYDDGPRVPALWVAPTEKLTRSFSDDRVMKMIRYTPALWDILEKGRRNKTTEKFLAGVRLGFGWAGSATELASHACGLVLVDERDRMVSDVDGEGDPLTLAEARTKNYPLRKIGVSSTPTIEGASPIWSLWEEGTREKWAWPCQECSTFFIPRLELLKWPKGATPSEARQKAFVVCPECGSELHDQHKPAMNRWGRYQAHVLDEHGNEHPVDELPVNTTRSFWISGLASPWQRFGELAEKLVAAYRSRDPGRIQGVVNTYGGEVWRVAGDSPDWQAVMGTRGAYGRATVPGGVRFITMGVDVQKDCLYWVIRGWGVNARSWLLDHGQLWGKTEFDNVWVALGNLLAQPIQDTPISRCFIDSGYRPGEIFRRPENVIYSFARRHRGLAYPTKGHQQQDKPLKANDIDLSIGGRTIKSALKLWHVNTDYAKTWLYAQIERPEGEPVAWETHAQIDEDYAKQVVAEEVITKASGQRVWMTRGPNHYLDCEVLTFAAALSLNVYALRDDDPKPPENAPIKPLSRRGSGFERHS